MHENNELSETGTEEYKVVGFSDTCHLVREVY